MSIKYKLKKAWPKSLLKPTQTVYHSVRLAKYKMQSVLSKKKWFCPCCGLKIDHFVEPDYLLPEKFNPRRYEYIRQDVLCAACMALPRHRILAAWCDDHLEYLQNSKILYFAPEHSMMLWMKRNKMTVTTADLFNEAELTLDIQDTGLLDFSYDIIICNHVLEHVDDFKKALKEVYRILRPKGSLICSFPMDPNVELVDEGRAITDEERYNFYGQNDHQRVFGMKSDVLLTEVGFVVEIIKGEDCPDEILPVVGPADYDMNILFRCIKPGDS